MKKIVLSTIAILSLSTTIHADTIGAEVGYAAWNAELSGNLQKGLGNLDFKQDLGYGDKTTNSSIWAYIDHPLPIIPNFKIQKTNYSDDSSGTITKNVTFDNQNFTLNDSVKSSIDLNQIDLIPYWRILDNWVNFDIGLNFKVIDGDISINSSTANADFSVVLPMLYTKARFDLPLTGLSVEADISYVSYDGNKFSDIKAGIVYETEIGLGATAGYKQQKITLDDIDDLYGELNIKGIYAGLFYHF